MAEQTDPPANDHDEDFGAFIGRRLRSYQTGVLGVGGVNLGAQPSAGSGGPAIVNRTADFSNSLQSLLSYRAAAVVASPPAGNFAAAPPIISRETDATEVAEAPAPAGPAAFGSPEWFAQMTQARAAIQANEQQTIDASLPPLSAIESALGISGGASAGLPSSDGTAPIRRRSAIREMPVTNQPITARSSDSVPAAREAVSEPSTEPEVASPSQPSRNEAAAQAVAMPGAPRVAPPIVQRRTRRTPPAAPVSSNPTRAVPPPAPSRVQPIEPTARDSEPTSSATTESTPSASVPSAPTVRRLVVPPSQDQQPPEGRAGVRRVSPTPPPPSGGAALRTTAVTPSVDTATRTAEPTILPAADSPNVSLGDVPRSSGPAETPLANTPDAAPIPNEIRRIVATAPQTASAPDGTASPAAPATPPGELAEADLSMTETSTRDQLVDTSTTRSRAEAVQRIAATATPAETAGAQATETPRDRPASPSSRREQFQSAAPSPVNSPDIVTPPASEPEAPMQRVVPEAPSASIAHPVPAGFDPVQSGHAAEPPSAPDAPVQRRVVEAATPLPTPDPTVTSQTPSTAPAIVAQEVPDDIASPNPSDSLRSPAPMTTAPPATPAAVSRRTEPANEVAASAPVTGMTPPDTIEGSSAPLVTLGTSMPSLPSTNPTAQTVPSLPAANTGPVGSNPTADSADSPDVVAGEPIRRRVEAEAPRPAEAGTDSPARIARSEPIAAPDAPTDFGAPGIPAQSASSNVVTASDASTDIRRSPADLEFPRVANTEPADTPSQPAAPSVPPTEAGRADVRRSPAPETAPRVVQIEPTGAASAPTPTVLAAPDAAVQRIVADPPASEPTESLATPTAQLHTAVSTGGRAPEISRVESTDQVAAPAHSASTPAPISGVGLPTASDAPVRRAVVADAPNRPSMDAPANTDSATAAPGGPVEASGDALTSARSSASADASTPFPVAERTASVAGSPATPLSASLTPEQATTQTPAARTASPLMRTVATAPSVSLSGSSEQPVTAAGPSEEQQATPATATDAPGEAPGAPAFQGRPQATPPVSDIRRATDVAPAAAAADASPALRPVVVAEQAVSASSQTVDSISPLERPSLRPTATGGTTSPASNPPAEPVQRSLATPTSPTTSSTTEVAEPTRELPTARQRVSAPDSVQPSFSSPAAAIGQSVAAPSASVPSTVQRSTTATPANMPSVTRSGAGQPVRIVPASAGSAPVSMPTLVAAPIQRASEPVEMPLAPPILREPVQNPPVGGATGSIQAVESSTNEPENSAPNYDQIANAVWPHIKRKIRIERERERGLPS